MTHGFIHPVNPKEAILFVRLTFDRESLEPLLIRSANEQLGITITPEAIALFEWEQDEEGDVTGVAIEFEAPEPQKEGTPSP